MKKHDCENKLNVHLEGPDKDLSHGVADSRVSFADLRKQKRSDHQTGSTFLLQKYSERYGTVRAS